MNKADLIFRLQSYPAMFGLDGSFNMYTAFLRGYSLAKGDGWMESFQEWLVQDLGYGDNLGWESLVLRKHFPGQVDLWCPFGPRDEKSEKILIRELFQLLDEFVAMRSE